MSHAMLTHALETGAIWSVARGLARNVDRYKTLLANCDQPRRNDLDGRGTLSEEALAAFTGFFLEVCLDQVRFMESLVQPDRLRTRILLWAAEETRLGQLPPQAAAILEAVLYRGEVPRADVAGVVGASERHARRAGGGASRQRRAHVREHARAAATRVPRRPCFALDARSVPRSPALLVAQSDHRIHRGRAAGRHKTRGQRHREQQAAPPRPSLPDRSA